jgi:uncharacterized membrane protein
MTYVLVPLLIVLMALTVWSLLRGVVAFLRTTRGAGAGTKAFATCSCRTA